VPAFSIRTYGDPVLRQRAAEIDDIDGAIRQLADGMIETMYAAAGLAVAAPQVGVEKRLFVYDLNDGAGPHTIVNPVIAELGGEWTFDEGCLSVPGLYFTLQRPATSCASRRRSSKAACSSTRSSTSRVTSCSSA